ncbi:MAG TPA: hypothetical protein VJT67_05460 [Longimicrobiaceae bacterium]|nr:hypothetical protein [Longimicrobiaceae bacterium]
MDLPAPEAPASSSKEDVRRFLAEFEAFFTALREDPVAWKEHMDEFHEWDCTLMDGLEDLDDEYSLKDPEDE